MALVKHERYPNYDSYIGEAYLARVSFHTPRLPFLDDLINWLAEEVIEAQVWVGGGEMLDLKIWIDDSNWGIIPTHDVGLEWKYYTPNLALGKQKLAWPAIFYAIIALLALIVIVFILKEVNTFFHGGNGPSPVQSLIALLVVGGGLFLAITLLVPKIKKKGKT